MEHVIGVFTVQILLHHAMYVKYIMTLLTMEITKMGIACMYLRKKNVFRQSGRAIMDMQFRIVVRIKYVKGY